MADQDEINRSTAIRLTYIREIEELEELGKESIANKSLQLRFKIAFETVEKIVCGFETAHFNLVELCDPGSNDLEKHLQIRSDFRNDTTSLGNMKLNCLPLIIVK